MVNTTNDVPLFYQAQQSHNGNVHIHVALEIWTDLQMNWNMKNNKIVNRSTYNCKYYTILYNWWKTNYSFSVVYL